MNLFRIGRIVVTFMCLMNLTACAETQLISHYVKQLPWPGEETARSEGTYKVGKSYKIDGRWYHPQEDFGLVETGVASWYGPGFHAKRTANGEVFDQNKLTAAHRTLQMPSLVQVTNLENGRSVVVRVNDRGPYKSDRIMDVSKRAAELLGFKGQGTAKVRIRVLEEESRRMASAAKAGRNTEDMNFEHASLSAWSAEKPVTRSASTSPSSSKSSPRMAGPYGVIASADPGWSHLRQNASMKGSDMPESLQAPVVTAGELQEDEQFQQAIHREAVEPATAAAPSSEKPAPVKASEPTTVDLLPPLPSHKPSSDNAQAATSSPPPSLASIKAAQNAKVTQISPSVSSSSPSSPASSKGGHVYILAGSFSVYENVKKMVDRYSDQAEAKVDTISVKNRQLYKVVFGPFETKEAARPLLEKIISAGSPTARVIVD